jgi:hypothetical protein
MGIIGGGLSYEGSIFITQIITFITNNNVIKEDQ